MECVRACCCLLSLCSCHDLPPQLGGKQGRGLHCIMQAGVWLRNSVGLHIHTFIYMQLLWH
jgi:hypothetical protein